MLIVANNTILMVRRLIFIIKIDMKKINVCDYGHFGMTGLEGRIVYRVWLLGVSGQLGQVIYHWNRENQIVVFSSDISQNEKIKD